MQAGYPDFSQHDSSKLQSLHIPSLPENMDDLSSEEKIQALVEHRNDETDLYYTAATGIHNDKHMEALQHPYLAMRRYLIHQTGYPWDANLINLRAALVGVTSHQLWNAVSSHPCPVSFSQEERERSDDERDIWNESEALLSTIRAGLAIDLEGGTTPENFERHHAGISIIGWKWCVSVRSKNESYIFRFGGKRITVTKDTLLNKRRPTIYRLELEEPRFGLPETVIVKQQKKEWEAEFCAEISAYKKLEKLQGTVIPTLFGEGSFNERPPLILSEIKGITLRNLAKQAETSVCVEENTLNSHLENAFQELYEYGAQHCDLNPVNFLVCDNGQVVVIDLEVVEFLTDSKLGNSPSIWVAWIT
ncbi:unnamed protein product [Penicillium egyptiacum]|uniref:Altered inheritance of mitochondria protein 9, mitochondrial n=1 Tax=Penicillium egyptiacum TaxID=1303716 RepID=A0A9W4KG18_9EURO|nr:unnamed protein product [Penicillium egyptiacum]